MEELALAFEQLGCWESVTEEENITVYGMDFPDKSAFIVFTDDAGKTPSDRQSPVVAACYSDDDCFLWGKEIQNFNALQDLCAKHAAGSAALLETIANYILPKK